MKLDRPLSPPLVHIERSLFGVSEMLIAAVERGETSAAIAAAVNGLSPVIMIVLMPMRRNSAKRSLMPPLTMSLS